MFEFMIEIYNKNNSFETSVEVSDFIKYIVQCSSELYFIM
jgi:hypothetical protein